MLPVLWVFPVMGDFWGSEVEGTATTTEEVAVKETGGTCRRNAEDELRNVCYDEDEV